MEGVRIHWAELGPLESAHPPLVLLHGIADSHLTWRTVAPLLARDRRVLMPDLPGCGLSERPNRSYSLSWETHMMARWIADLGLEQLDLVGHSYGGGVAQMLLLECLDRIQHLVLVASGGLGKEVGFWLKLATFPVAVELLGQPFMAFGTRRSLNHSQQEGAAADVHRLSRMNALPGTARAFSRMVRDVIDWRGQTRLFGQRAREISEFPPIAVLWGAQDPIIPCKQGEAFVREMVGSVFLPFSNAGHYVHHDAPEAFVDAVLSFVDAPTASPVHLRPRPSPESTPPTKRLLPSPLQSILHPWRSGQSGQSPHQSAYRGR